MPATHLDIKKITKQFNANLQAVERMEKKLEIVKEENRQMMKLLSEQKDAPDSLLDIKVQKILARKHSRIKNL